MRGCSRDLGPPLLTAEGHNVREYEENCVDFKQSLWRFFSVTDLEWVVTCFPQGRGHQKIIKAPISLLTNYLLSSRGQLLRDFPEVVIKRFPHQRFPWLLYKNQLVSHRDFVVLHVELRTEGWRKTQFPQTDTVWQQCSNKGLWSAKYQLASERDMLNLHYAKSILCIHKSKFSE